MYEVIGGLMRGILNSVVIFLLAAIIRSIATFQSGRTRQPVRWLREWSVWIGIACAVAAMILDAIGGNFPLDFALVPFAVATYFVVGWLKKDTAKNEPGAERGAP